MGNKIRVLSDRDINQIAAGEVIENPASVVKELLENARDAGSTSISVEVMGGGFQKISVHDNGEGMGSDDALLAFERHATSKIQSSQDLQKLQTMGFRGEALASIAAVSKVHLTSSEGKEGTEVVIEGGKWVKTGSIGRGQGTTISVSSLFYNTPARQKFQRGERAALSHIQKVITKEALASPHITFSCTYDGKESLSCVPFESSDFLSQIKERIRSLLGKSFLNEMVPIEMEEEGISMQGYIGKNGAYRHRRLSQYLFVNGRPLTSFVIERAIRDGYGTRIPERTFPIFVLHISMPSHMIDVNVHPQKKEARFQKEDLIRHKVTEAIDRALQAGEKKAGPILPMDWKEKKQGKKGIPFDMGPPFLFREERQEKVAVERPLLESTLSLKGLSKVALLSPYLLVWGWSMRPLFPEMEVGDIVVCDLKAIGEKLLFEEGLEDNGSKEYQECLFPLSLEYSLEESALLMPLLEELKGIGISLRPFGQTTFLIDALSPWIEEGEVKKAIDILLKEREGKGLIDGKKKRKKLSLIASSVARKKWSEEEAEKAILLLSKTSSPYHSPSGHMTMKGLDRETIKEWMSGKTAMALSL